MENPKILFSPSASVGVAETDKKKTLPLIKDTASS